MFFTLILNLFVLISNCSDSIEVKNKNTIEQTVIMAQSVDMEAYEVSQENESLADVEKMDRNESDRVYADKPQYEIILDPVHDDYLWTRCKAKNISYELMIALIFQESRFDNSEIGENKTTIDVGYCQINSCNFGWLEEEYGIEDIYDPYQNIDAGIEMLSSLLLKYKDENIALMAYNMGENGMKRSGKKSSEYSRSVLKYKNELIETGGLSDE